MTAWTDKNEALRWRELLPAAGILLLLLVLFHGGAVYGAIVFCGGDIINQDHPLRQYWLREGFLTGWYSASFSGYPFFANTQAGVLYPPNLLYWIGLPVERTTTWLVLGHSLAGALGFYAFARRWTSRLVALLPAFLWMCGGYQLLRNTNGVVIFTYGMNWIPWMWLAAERCGDGAKRWTILLGLFGAMQFLAGAPQLVHITWCGLLVWLVGRGVAMGSWRERAWLAAHCAGAVVLMTVIAFPQLWASWEFSSLGAGRGADSNWDYIARDSFLPRLFIAILLPTFFDVGNAEATYWGGTTGYLETNVYIGAAALVLAAFGFVFAATGVRRRGGGERDTLRLCTVSAILAVAGMSIALGRHFFVFRILFDLVPGFDMFRVPARWQLWCVAPAILFGGIGLQALLDSAGQGLSSRTARRAFIVWACVSGGAIALCATLRIATPALLTFFGFDLVESFRMSPELAETARRRAERAGEWALGTVAIAGFAGAAVILRPTGRNALLFVLGLVMVTDQRLYWAPFSHAVPTDIPRAELPTEAPYHRIAASGFQEYFYPETDAVRSLRAGGEGRLFFTDSLYFYGVDEFVREFYADRPAVTGMESMRGYYPLLLRSYVDDFFSIAYGENEQRPAPGAFLASPLIMNRWPIDAYNADRILRFRTPREPPSVTDQLLSTGIVRAEEFTFSGEYGSFTLERWENPHAPGWAWLSTESEWPGLEGRIQGVELRDMVRGADSMTFGMPVPEEPAEGVWLHFAEVDYPGWTIGIDGNRAGEGRSVEVSGRAGETIEVERRFALPLATRVGLPISAFAFLAGIAGAVLARPRREDG